MPTIDESAFLATGVQIIGDVRIGRDSGVWYNAVLRGDLAPITIGDRSNIQDGVIGHVNTSQPLLIGDDVSVGHGAIIHGCTIGSGSLIGMGAIVLNGVEIGEFVLVGAGSLITENTKIPPYTLCLGSPARVVRELTEADLERMRRTTDSYVIKSREFRGMAKGSTDK
ncbi:gamma carbonic anhydrase family protein [Gorillibacterium massiliense]|uniref:gamma carbonic anhydrase family protein n=1 Tax=Gorillibacterium massiliense TaxID=1280390 RepID=UPI00192E31E3|nr:gamma carbonic anhydrase family protein [Gorillibacterium massiliense]